MALSSEGNVLTDQHRRRQAALSVDVLAHMRRLWPQLAASDLDGTRGPWASNVLDVVAQGYVASAGLAAAYLPQFRAVERAPGPAVLPPLRPANLDAARAALELLGPIRIKQRLAGGMDLAEAMRIAEGQVAAAAQSAVANGGRTYVLDTVHVDKAAVGWARIAGAGACAFCAMLCSRGPVYRSDRTAGFRPHPGCNCTAEPVYHDSPDAWAPIAEHYADEWVSASLDADLDAVKTSDTRRGDRRKRGGDAERRAALAAYKRGEGPQPPPLERLNRQPTQRDRDALNAYRRHLYSQRTTGAANARRADQLADVATARRAAADATPSSAGKAREANIAEAAAARAAANTAAVRQADELAATAAATADELIATNALDAAHLERRATEAAGVHTEERHLAEQAAKAADGAELDEQGHPWRLTVDYLEDLTDEEVDSLVDYCAEGVATDNPLELARWEDLEVWLDYRDAYNGIVEQAGTVADAVVTRELADLAATKGRVGLTHRADEATAGDAAVAAKPTRREVQREYALYLEELYVRAENGTRGTLVNKKGQARGVTGYELLKGDVRRLLRYGSEELLEFFEDPANRRVQWAEFYADRTGSQAFADLAAKQRDRNARIDRDRNGVQ